jgi:mRNA-degrading endonuclease YafQ of YafQ-DinJ toxin-antitoxin module
MRTIEWTAAFRRDYKRTKATPRHKDIETLLPEIVGLMVDDKPLKEKFRDHGLGACPSNAKSAVMATSACGSPKWESQDLAT